MLSSACPCPAVWSAAGCLCSSTWSRLPNKPQRGAGLWLTCPRRFTVSRKTPLTVNRKVRRPEGERRDRRRVGSVHGRPSGMVVTNWPLATGSLSETTRCQYSSPLVLVSPHRTGMLHCHATIHSGAASHSKWIQLLHRTATLRFLQRANTTLWMQ